MNSGFDPVTPQPGKRVDCETFARLLANVPGIVAVECRKGAATGTEWIDILLPGDKTLRVKATSTGQLIYTANYAPGEG